MELRHLRYFVAVAETLNFTRAARNLGTAQPPLSVQIRNLETELGVSLFQRTNRRVRLTAAGTAFLGDARQILASADRAVLDLQDRAAGRTGRLRLVLEFGTLSERLNKRLRKFIRKHRGVRMDIQCVDSKQVISNIEHDVAIVQKLETGEEDIELESSIVCLAVPPKHRFRSVSAIDPDDLTGETLLFAAADELSAAEGYCEQRIPPAAIIRRVNGPGSTVNRLCQANLGLGLTPCSSDAVYLGDAIAVPFKGGEGALKTVLSVSPTSTSPAIDALKTFILS